MWLWPRVKYCPLEDQVQVLRHYDHHRCCVATQRKNIGGELPEKQLRFLYKP